MHKTPLKLDKLSQEVFELDDRYKIIIRCIALNGPSPKSKILECVEKSEEVIFSRTSLGRMLVGSNRVLGLVEKEYLATTDGVKRRWGAQQTYHLTVKGLLAALSTGVSLKKIYLYEQFIFLSSVFLKYRNILNIIEEFITNEIFAFLSWHAFNGIQLQKLINSQKYYENISKILWDKKTYWGKIDPQTFNNLQKIWRDYHVFLNAISIVNKSNVVLTRKTLPVSIKKEIPSLISKVIWNAGFDRFIFDWPAGMAVLYKLDFDRLKNAYQKPPLNEKELVDLKYRLKDELGKKGYSNRDLKIIDL